MTFLTRKISLLVVLMLGIGLTTVFGQVQATNGSIRGDVMDAARSWRSRRGSGSTGDRHGCRP